MNTEYKIVRSDRKTIAIEIKRDGTVIIRAPKRCRDGVINDFVASKEGWITKHLTSLPAPAIEKTKEELDKLRERARELIFPRVEYYSRIMNLYPTSLKITSAKTRFGSCSPKNGLCFSLFLAEYPNEAIDYVIVHELAHIKHKNHSAAFHNLVRKYLPNEKELINILKGRSEA